jgi:hypothetical protein
VNPAVTGPPQLRAYEAGGTRPPAPIAATPPGRGAEAAAPVAPLRIGPPARQQPAPGAEPGSRRHWLPAGLALVVAGAIAGLIAVWRRSTRRA